MENWLYGSTSGGQGIVGRYCDSPGMATAGIRMAGSVLGVVRSGWIQGVF